MVQVSIAQAKARFASLIAKAEAGEEIVITRNGMPVARVAPLRAAESVTFDDLSDLEIPDDFSLPEEAIDAFYPENAKWQLP